MPIAWETCILRINTEDIFTFWSNCLPDDVFFKGIHAYFNNDKPHSAHVTTA